MSLSGARVRPCRPRIRPAATATLQPFMKGSKVTKLRVYSTGWCPDCRVLKRFLAEEGVAYEEIDIDHQPEAAAELLAATGKRGIPYMRVGERWFKGYPLDAGAFRRLLDELRLR
jgi:glutaredoxin 3